GLGLGGSGFGGSGLGGVGFGGSGLGGSTGAGGAGGVGAGGACASCTCGASSMKRTWTVSGSDTCNNSGLAVITTPMATACKATTASPAPTRMDGLVIAFQDL